MKPLVNSIASTLILLTTALLTGCDIGKGAVIEGVDAVKAAINQVDKVGGAISGRNSAVEACTNAVKQIHPTAALVQSDNYSDNYRVVGLNKFEVTFVHPYATCYIDNGKVTEIVKLND